jgi:hypothetical protein
VNISFGGLDVVVEIVPESLNVRNDLFPPLICQMSREQDYIVSVTPVNGELDSIPNVM